MTESEHPDTYTSRNDAIYSRLAGIYDFAVRDTSLYTRWLLPVLPHIRGPRVLEISFGTGWLMTHYASQFETYGVDLNWNMIRITGKNLASAGLAVPLKQARVETLPYRAGSFDTVANTMAFGGYPRADDAMTEIRRVLKPRGRLIIVDISTPAHWNWLSRVYLYLASRDILRDMGQVFRRHGFIYTDEAVGLCGALHLYMADKNQLATSTHERTKTKRKESNGDVEARRGSSVLRQNGGYIIRCAIRSIDCLG